MIDDRNLFRPDITIDAVDTAARELDRVSAYYADAPASADAILRDVESLIDRLGTARNKLAVQVGVLNAAAAAGAGGLLNVGEIDTRHAAALSVLAAIDDFVGVRVPRVEAQARDPKATEAERIAAATRLREATIKILRVAGDFDPIGDLVEDVKQAARDVADAAAKVIPKTTNDLAIIVTGVAIIAVVLLVRDLVR
jgi:hypothetical protein